MDREGNRVSDPAAYQPSKDELLEDVRIEAAPEAPARNEKSTKQIDYGA